MKIVSTIIIYLCVACLCLSAQSGTWTWMKGDSLVNSAGNFGALGVAASTNEPPAKFSPAQWADSLGNFWIYGGYDEYDNGVEEDFWKFDPTTLMWTWMGGQPGLSGAAVYGPAGAFNSTNWPGPLAYGPITWVDKNNHLWMYGGINNNDALNNLWQYDPVLNQWAWMGGSQNTTNAAPVYGTMGTGTSSTQPGSRIYTQATWTDSANLWFFGGVANRFTTSGHNDVWRYNITSGIWTWMSGTNATGGAGTYGVKGVASVNYIPSGRISNMHWQDANGNFYLSGGFDWTSYWDDVWKFNPNTLEWTWLNGSQNSVGPPGVTPFCKADSTYTYGGRFDDRATWKYCDNIIITFGGFTVTYGQGLVNDVWAYVPVQNEWLKLTDGSANGNYGTQGVSSPSNYPPARFGGAGFIDKQRNLWHFSGRVTNAGFQGNGFNDLWKYTVDTTCIGGLGCSFATSVPLQVQTAFTNAVCAACNASVSVTASNGTPPYHYTWLPGSDTSATLQNLCAGTYHVTVTDAGGGSFSDSIVITTSAAPVVNLGNDTGFCTGGQQILHAGNPGASYLWQDNSTDSIFTASASGLYWVQVTSGGCPGSDTISLTVNALPVPALGGDTAICNGHQALLNASNPGSAYIWSNAATTQTISVGSTGIYSVTVTNASGCTNEDSIAVTIDTLAAAINSNKQIMCSGDSAHICATAAFAAYRWNTGDTAACIYTNIAGVYNLTVTDNNHCSAASNQLNISNYQTTPVTVSVNGDTLTSYNAVSYQWYFNGQAIAGDTSKTIVATQNGNYSVQITDNNGCRYNSTPTTVAIGGVEHIDIDDNLKVYPNPLSGDYWHIEAGAGWLGAQIEIYNVNGQIVYRSQLISTTYEIPLHVSNGVYVLRVGTDAKSVCLKLIKL